MLSIIILCNCSVPSQLWAAIVSHWVKRIARCKFQNRLGLGAVLGISAVSATFSRIFSGFWAGFGCCFRDFCSFSYFFPGLFRLFGWILGAVLEISAVSATFSQIFSGFWAEFGCCFRSFRDYSHQNRINETTLAIKFHSACTIPNQSPDTSHAGTTFFFQNVW